MTRDDTKATPASAQVLDWVLEPIAPLIVPDHLAPGFAVTETSLRALKNAIVRVIPNAEFEAAAERFKDWPAEKRSPACMGLGELIGKAILHNLNETAGLFGHLDDKGESAIPSARLLGQALSLGLQMNAIVASWPDALYPTELANEQWDDETPHPYDVTTDELLEELAPFQSAGRGAELAILLHSIQRAGRIYTLVDSVTPYQSILDPLAQALALTVLHQARRVATLGADYAALKSAIHRAGTAVQGVERILAAHEYPDVQQCVQRARTVVTGPVESHLKDFQRLLRTAGSDDAKLTGPNLAAAATPEFLTTLEMVQDHGEFVASIGQFANYLGFSLTYGQVIATVKSDLEAYAESAFVTIVPHDDAARDHRAAVIEQICQLLETFGEIKLARFWRHRVAVPAATERGV